MVIRVNEGGGWAGGIESTLVSVGSGRQEDGFPDSIQLLLLITSRYACGVN